MINTGLTLITAPTSEPITIDEVISHLRIDGSDEYGLIESYIKAARVYCEKWQNRAYIPQTWMLDLDDFPDEDYINIPLPPLQSVSSVVYYDTDDNNYTLSTSEYLVDIDNEPGRIYLNYSKTWPSITLRPANAVEITFIAGYGDADDVPQHIKQAILLLVGHMYENREATSFQNFTELPFAVESLLWTDRIVNI